MAANPPPVDKDPCESARLRNELARNVLWASIAAIAGLAVIAILATDGKQAMPIFNTLLPVVASWVGTILAFYFGRENFEAANASVKKLIDRLSPEQRASQPVSAVMRTAAQTTSIQFSAAKGEADYTLADVRRMLQGDVSRLPVLDSAGKPLFLLHGSTVDRYLATPNPDTHTLKQLLDSGKCRTELGPNRGFVTVAEKDTLATAKSRMEAVAGCQDIFVTADGTNGQRLLGWITNVRLAKYLQA